jgi:hypothetical protein
MATSKDLDLFNGELVIHIVQLKGGCQCLRKVELMLRMINALGHFPLPLKKTSAISTVKTIVVNDARYTLGEISDFRALARHMCFPS